MSGRDPIYLDPFPPSINTNAHIEPAGIVDSCILPQKDILSTIVNRIMDPFDIRDPIPIAPLHADNATVGGLHASDDVAGASGLHERADDLIPDSHAQSCCPVDLVEPRCVNIGPDLAAHGDHGAVVDISHLANRGVDI